MKGWGFPLCARALSLWGIWMRCDGETAGGTAQGTQDPGAHLAVTWPGSSSLLDSLNLMVLSAGHRESWKPVWSFAMLCCLCSVEQCIWALVVWVCHWLMCFFLLSVNLSALMLNSHALTEWLGWAYGQDRKVLMSKLSTPEHLACLS